MNITFKIVGMREFSQALSDRADGITNQLVDKVNTLVDILYEKIIAKLSGGLLNEKTGRLIRSVRKEEVRIGLQGFVGGYVSQDGRIAPYGIVQERGGSREYEIFPVNKRILAWMSDGKWIFAKMVRHPPLPPRSFMISSLEEMREQIVEEIRTVAKV